MPAPLGLKKIEKPLDSCTTGIHVSKLMCPSHRLRKGGVAVEMPVASVGFGLSAGMDRPGVNRTLVAINNTLRCK